MIIKAVFLQSVTNLVHKPRPSGDEPLRIASSWPVKSTRNRYWNHKLVRHSPIANLHYSSKDQANIRKSKASNHYPPWEGSNDRNNPGSGGWENLKKSRVKRVLSLWSESLYLQIPCRLIPKSKLMPLAWWCVVKSQLCERIGSPNLLTKRSTHPFAWWLRRCCRQLHFPTADSRSVLGCVVRLDSDVISVDWPYVRKCHSNCLAIRCQTHKMISYLNDYILFVFSTSD